MREPALLNAAGERDIGAALSVLREWAECAALRSLHESKAFTGITMTGAAALRFANGSPRRTGVLEFALDPRMARSPAKWLFKMKRDLRYRGFSAKIAFASRAGSHSARMTVSWPAGCVGPGSGLPRANTQGNGATDPAPAASPPDGTFSARSDVAAALGAGGSVSFALSFDPALHGIECAVPKMVDRAGESFAVRCAAVPAILAGAVHGFLLDPPANRDTLFDIAWCVRERPGIEPDPALLDGMRRRSGLDPVSGNWRAALRSALETPEFRDRCHSAGPGLGQDLDAPGDISIPGFLKAT